MKMLTDTTASKVVSSIPIWFVVFLIVVFGGPRWSRQGTGE